MCAPFNVLHVDLLCRIQFLTDIRITILDFFTPSGNKMTVQTRMLTWRTKQNPRERKKRRRKSTVTEVSGNHSQNSKLLFGWILISVFLFSCQRREWHWGRRTTETNVWWQPCAGSVCSQNRSPQNRPADLTPNGEDPCCWWNHWTVCEEGRLVRMDTFYLKLCFFYRSLQDLGMHELF